MSSSGEEKQATGAPKHSGIVALHADFDDEPAATGAALPSPSARPASSQPTSPGKGRAGGADPAGVEMTSMMRGGARAAAATHETPAMRHLDQTAAAVEDALSADEEEQIKMEAQTGMLLTAAAKNNVKRLRGLLNAGVPPNAGDYDQRTALHVACSGGHLEAAQVLIEEGADPNAKDRFGSTPLDDAMRAAHHDLVAFLKSKKAKHGGLDKLQAKLFEHCAKGEMAALRVLLAKDVDGNPVVGSAGISPNVCDYNKRTPLHIAVSLANTELVDLLLANGADPNAADQWGLTPLAEVDRLAARVGTDPVKEVFRKHGLIHHEESVWSFFSLVFASWELAMMILIGLFCTYGESSQGGQSLDEELLAGGHPRLSLDEYTAPSNPAQQAFSRVYPLYQDVHVMIFVGFAFLMVFLRKHGYSSVGFTLLVGAFVIQWFQLCGGFWHNAFEGHWVKIPLSVSSLVKGDFAAGSVLITYGVLLGKVNPAQLLFVAIIEVIFYALNEEIGIAMGAADVGGTMTIHMFGAFFGAGCTWMMTPKAAHGHELNTAGYHSDIMAMIGTIFLWMYWPSFNGALSVANSQERCVINTVMSMCGSCVVAFIASHVLRRERRFNMVDIQNATVAGGVAIGASADMMLEPGAALGIGGLGGLISVAGYVYVQPWLESKLSMHDTCGVNNLHGMPSILGGFASVIAAGLAHVDGYRNHKGYGFAQLAWTFPKRDYAENPDAREAHTQAAIQFAYMCTTFFIALFSGVITGHLATLRVFTPTAVENMYKDDAYWETPELETPYYFDHRGEVAHGEGTAPAAKDDKQVDDGAEGEEGGALRHVDGVNLDAPDNARLLGLISALEQRVNQLSRRVGAQVSQLPLSGPAAVPQSHVTKSALPPGVHTDYPPSRLVAGGGGDAGAGGASASASPSVAGEEAVLVQPNGSPLATSSP